MIGARRSGERPFSVVPPAVLAMLALVLAAQIALRISAATRAEAVPLESPPPLAALRIADLGEPEAFAYAAALRLQAFDNQPGISIPFARLDYGHLEAWLATLLRLDPGGVYALQLATYVYGQVGQPEKQRAMCEFVYREFLRDPSRRWPMAAHVTIMAKHRLSDLPLAIRYADGLRDHATGPDVPAWVRQMHIFLRADVGEIESAKALLGGLLASGTVTDPREIAFLTERLHDLERRVENSAVAPNP